MQIRSVTPYNILYNQNERKVYNKPSEPSFIALRGCKRGSGYSQLYKIDNDYFPYDNLLKCVVVSLRRIKLLHNMKFTVKEYEKLSESDKKFLRKQYESLNHNRSWDFYFKSLEDAHLVVPLSMECLFDKLYGKGNYKVIVIGRSLSSMGKALGYRIGEENVINLPFSHAYRFHDFEKNKERIQEIPYLLKYLEKKGITADEVKNSGKHYIITDYSNSGASLDSALELFTSDRVWGNRTNVHAIDVQTALKAIDGDESLLKYFKSYNSANLMICSNLNYCYYKDFSFVHVCRDFSKADKSEVNVRRASNKLKLVWFKFLDNMMTYSKGYYPPFKIICNPVE